MAFYASQNSITFDGYDDAQTAYLKLLQLFYKTLNEAASKEKAAQGRSENYWRLDPTRHNGSFDAVPGSGDNAIYNYSSSTSSAALGMFLVNGAGETAFITYSNNYSVGTSKGSSGLVLHPMVGYSDYSDNGHVNGVGPLDSFYGLGMSVSKNDFGGLENPWESGFFSDGDLKIVTDGNNSLSSSLYNSGNTLKIIVCVDSKCILINSRLSYEYNVDRVLLYGNFLVNNDMSDTETDCILSLPKGSTSKNSLRCMFRDKDGSTTWYPNGSNLNGMRLSKCTVNTAMLDGSNASSIPFTGISFGWISISDTIPNQKLNGSGIGYKGISDTSKIRVVTPNPMISNKSVLNNQWMCIAKHICRSSSSYEDVENFSLLVAWDSSNDPIS